MNRRVASSQHRLRWGAVLIYLANPLATGFAEPVFRENSEGQQFYFVNFFFHLADSCSTAGLDVTSLVLNGHVLWDSLGKPAARAVGRAR